MVDSDVGWGWDVEVDVVDSEVGKRWWVRVMFNELVVAVGSVVEMGEAKERGTAGVWRINKHFHIQILKYTILLLLLSYSSICSLIFLTFLHTFVLFITSISKWLIKVSTCLLGGLFC